MYKYTQTAPFPPLHISLYYFIHIIIIDVLLLYIYIFSFGFTLNQPSLHLVFYSSIFIQPFDKNFFSNQLSPFFSFQNTHNLIAKKSGMPSPPCSSLYIFFCFDHGLKKFFFFQAFRVASRERNRRVHAAIDVRLLLLWLRSTNSANSWAKFALFPSFSLWFSGGLPAGIDIGMGIMKIINPSLLLSFRG